MSSDEHLKKKEEGTYEQVGVIGVRIVLLWIQKNIFSLSAQNTSIESVFKSVC